MQVGGGGAGDTPRAMRFVRFCKLLPFWASLENRSFYQNVGDGIENIVEKHRAAASTRRVHVVLWGL